LAAAAATSASGTINFTLTGNEAISCSSISATNGDNCNIFGDR
jgi:hypothetical protein